MSDYKDPYEDAPHKKPGSAAIDRKHGTVVDKGVWRPDPAPTKSGIKREACKNTETKSGKYGKCKVF